MTSKLLDVYGRWPIDIVRGQGCEVESLDGKKYVDLYGGHAVISIGHSHPHYLQKLENQLQSLAFYSNAVEMPIQQEAAEVLTTVSGYGDAKVFFCNSGAEAIENALKIASFHTGRKKILCFSGGFHGRTSLAVACTDNENILAPVNETDVVVRVNWDCQASVQKAFRENDFAAVLIEPIQGIGGCRSSDKNFLNFLSKLCEEKGALLILDEIQSGCGRSGKYFAHQAIAGDEFKADIVTIAKGIGNGFPVGAVLVSSKLRVQRGDLGTTFGGNPLACAAVIAVHEVLQKDKLLNNVSLQGDWLKAELEKIPQIRKVEGAGLMLGLYFDENVQNIRKALVLEHNIFVGSAASPNCIRLLPPLNVERPLLEKFVSTLKLLLKD